MRDVYFYACGDCYNKIGLGVYLFSDFKSLKEHIKLRHVFSKTPLCCPECEENCMAFTSWKEYIIHFQTYHHFSMEKILSEHMERYWENDGIYVCKDCCNRCTNYRVFLMRKEHYCYPQNHVHCIPEEYPYKCDRCGEYYARNERVLMFHEKTCKSHEEEPPEETCPYDKDFTLPVQKLISKGTVGRLAKNHFLLFFPELKKVL